jgi:hypothetical protein
MTVRSSQQDPTLVAALEPGERLMWQGRPSALGLLRASGREAFTGLVLLGFSWLSFQAVLGDVTADADLMAELERGFSDSDLRFVAFIGAFILPFALWLVTAPLRGMRRAARLVYGVTDRRVLVAEIGGKLESFGPGQIHNLDIVGGAGGHDVVFEEGADRLGSMYRKHFSMSPRKGFYGVDDPKGAASAIARLQ